MVPVAPTPQMARRRTPQSLGSLLISTGARARVEFALISGRRARSILQPTHPHSRTVSPPSLSLSLPLISHSGAKADAQAWISAWRARSSGGAVPPKRPNKPAVAEAAAAPAAPAKPAAKAGKAGKAEVLPDGTLLFKF